MVSSCVSRVLILVVMDNSLVHLIKPSLAGYKWVLILVVMDNSLVLSLADFEEAGASVS